MSTISSRSDVEDVQPPSGGFWNGDFGACEDGFVRYWWTGKDEAGSIETANVAMYFDRTGEFCILHGTAIQEQYLGIESLLKGWSQALRRANRLFDKLGAFPVRRIEAGLSGLSGVRWTGRVASESPPSRKPSFSHSMQARGWKVAEQLEFLRIAYNGIRNLYAWPPITGEKFRDFIMVVNPEILRFEQEEATAKKGSS